MLLKAGARVDSMLEDQQTVIQAAIESHNIDLVQILIDAGNDINAPAASLYARTALPRRVNSSWDLLLQLARGRLVCFLFPASNATKSASLKSDERSSRPKPERLDSDFHLLRPADCLRFLLLSSTPFTHSYVCVPLFLRFTFYSSSVLRSALLTFACCISSALPYSLSLLGTAMTKS